MIGHSLGSTISLLYGALFGARSIVAVDPAPLYVPHLSDMLAPYKDRMFGDDFDAAFVDWERASFDFGPLSPAYVLASMVHSRAEVVQSYWAIVFDRDRSQDAATQLSDALAGMATPALILLARPPRDEDQTILNRMPSAAIEVWDGQGHWLHLVDPGRFADRVRGWIAALPG